MTLSSPTNISLSFQWFLVLSNLTNITLGLAYKEKTKITEMRLTSNCTSHLVRLDEYQKVELTSNTWPLADEQVPANTICTAHFMTGNPDQGICITNNDLYFKRPEAKVQIRFYTSKLGPERTFNTRHSRFDQWCTDESLVSVELNAGRNISNHNGEYRYSFNIRNVSLEDISKTYTMDSFKQCNLSHTLEPGEEIRISGQRHPTPDYIPSSCLLNFSTKSTAEYDEVCIQLESHEHHKDCMTLLKVDGFNDRFWPASEVLGCNDTQTKLRKFDEMCSKDKTLALNLTRLDPGGTEGMTFMAVVKVKKHPFWETIKDENSQIQGLNFIKGLVYFVACVDSVAGVAAAIMANMFRKPRGFWKSWAESFVTAPRLETTAHYGSGVNYPEVSGCQVEEITEAKPY